MTGERVGTVARLWRYPVKSMRGEQCDALELQPRGAKGDRWYAVRTADGLLGSGKNTRRFRAIDGLLDFQARHGEDGPEVRFPDGRTMRADDPRIHAALSAALGTPVTLAREAQVPHFDDGAIHVLSLAALDWLRTRLAGDGIDERRFRPNLVVEARASGQAEQSWIGRVLRVGGASLKVTASTERCRMTTLAQGDLPEDPAILRSIAQDADLQFGVYADVLTPGRVAVGDAIVLGA